MDSRESLGPSKPLATLLLTAALSKPLDPLPSNPVTTTTSRWVWCGPEPAGDPFASVELMRIADDKAQASVRQLL